MKLAANPTAATATEGTNDSWGLPKNKDKGPLVGKKQRAKKNHTGAKLQTMEEGTIFFCYYKKASFGSTTRFLVLAYDLEGAFAKGNYQH